MTEIILANKITDYILIEQLADTIWREHYVSITGIGQVEYMLKKYQSAEAIANQIEDGYLYFIIKYDKSPVGYISIKKENNTLFLSKVYVSKDYRGKKIGKAALQFIDDKAIDLNCTKVRLTVNKDNVIAIAAYKKLGYITTEPVVMDIGGGFVMDDYKMEKTL